MRVVAGTQVHSVPRPHDVHAARIGTRLARQARQRIHVVVALLHRGARVDVRDRARGARPRDPLVEHVEDPTPLKPCIERLTGAPANTTCVPTELKMRTAARASARYFMYASPSPIIVPAASCMHGVNRLPLNSMTTTAGRRCARRRPSRATSRTTRCRRRYGEPPPQWCRPTHRPRSGPSPPMRGSRRRGRRRDGLTLRLPQGGSRCPRSRTWQGR